MVGNRIIVPSIGDEEIGVYRTTNTNDLVRVNSTSTGVSPLVDSPLIGGIGIDVGLPPLLQTPDSNLVVGLDHGDFNDDGIEDLAVLTYRFETWVAMLRPDAIHTRS